jgi:serine/threonine protein kinase
MPAPSSPDEFLDLVRKSGVLDEKRLAAYEQQLRASGTMPADAGKLAGAMIRDGLLTHFQGEQFLLGRWRRFTIGKYKVLERLGSGGMGSVYLCEHKFMRRRVAVKVLPAAKAEDPAALERFYREARAVAALDHPNIVRAYDIDQDDKLHFLVMEYVDGTSLQDVVKKHGTMDVLRAAHYLRQSAIGLQHAHEAHLVHRDIKPGNLLIDRSGTIKILDMGLARFFNDESDNLTKKHDENVLGTADYLAPEQALDSHGVDIRADIYSLGATFYFVLTGSTPFNEGTVAQKLIWHQTRQPKAIRAIRPEVPQGLVTILDKMMAKDPGTRFQTPAQLIEALTPWTQTPIPAPPEKEMPRLCAAAMGNVPPDSGAAGGGSGTRPSTKSQASSSAARANSPFPTRTSAAAGRTAPARTAPTPAAAALTTKPTTETEENGAPWEGLGEDTANPSAKNDTDPASSLKKAPISSSSHLLNRPGSELLNKRALIVIAAVGGFFVLALTIALWLWFFRGPKPVAATSAPTLYYVTSRSDQPNAVRTVREALARAHGGERIVVEEDLEEPLMCNDGRMGRNVTVEAAAGKTVVWKYPVSRGEGNPFVMLQSIENLRLKGFTFDGGNRVRDLIQLIGNCPGVVLEDLHLRNFTRHGINIANCEGQANSKVTLSRIRFQGGKDAESGLNLYANPRITPAVNRFIEISECRFEGPFKVGAMQIEGASLDLDLRRNRFWKANEGVHVKGVTSLAMTVASNTIYDTITGLHMEALPPNNPDHKIDLRDNLFIGATKGIVTIDGKVTPQQLQPLFTPTPHGNARDATSLEGNFATASKVVTVTPPLATNVDDDATFLRYTEANSLSQNGLPGVAP